MLEMVIHCCLLVGDEIPEIFSTGKDSQLLEDHFSSTELEEECEYALVRLEGGFLKDVEHGPWDLDSARVSIVHSNRVKLIELHYIQWRYPPEA